MLHPELAREWHPTKNGELSPHHFVAFSKKRVWWICQKGPDHEWQASVGDRVRGSTCLCCRGMKLSVTNRLDVLFPALSEQWHPTKNGQLGPHQVTAGSSRIVWWRCNEGPDHEWTATISNRTLLGHGCSFCAGKRVSITNSIASVHPVLASQWHPVLNGDLTPYAVTIGSNIDVWWTCDKASDHMWSSTVANRVAGNDCPYCSGKKPSSTNNLALLYPDIAQQWHPTKNGELTPIDVVRTSHRKVWWKCAVGPDHEWQANIANRTNPHTKNGCPFCRGLLPSITNSLDALYPQLSKQWHPVKNGDISPDNVVAGSERHYWWQCLVSSDHVWKATPRRRAIERQGCPLCMVWRGEEDLHDQVKRLFPEEEILRRTAPDWLKPQHFDIWLPSTDVAIEYHGEQHYRPHEYFGGEEGFADTQRRDDRKRKLCATHGISLLEVRYDCPLSDEEISTFVMTSQLARTHSGLDGDA